MDKGAAEALAPMYVARLQNDFPEVFMYPADFFKLVEEWSLRRRKADNSEIAIKFEQARKAYPGVKRGHEVEVANFIKKHKDYMIVVDFLLPAIKKAMEYEQFCLKSGKFCAPWQNFQTWINQRSWEREYPKHINTQLAPSK